MMMSEAPDTHVGPAREEWYQAWVEVERGLKFLGALEHRYPAGPPRQSEKKALEAAVKAPNPEKQEVLRVRRLWPD